jgi:hypothetical protein
MATRPSSFGGLQMGRDVDAVREVRVPADVYGPPVGEHRERHVDDRCAALGPRGSRPYS